MKLDIKIPSPGESVNEVTISILNKNNGDYVEKDEILFEIESDKATLTIPAEASGTVSMLVQEGDTVPVGTIACQIDTSQTKTDSEPTTPPKEVSTTSVEKTPDPVISAKTPTLKATTPESAKVLKIPSIAAEKILAEKQIDLASVAGTGKDGRITKQDVIKVGPEATGKVKTEAAPQKPRGERAEEAKKVTPLRKKIAERLVQVKNETAMLTTFNEIDMSAVMAIRKKYQDQFVKKYGIKLGFMSFFSKAAVLSLQKFPELNAYYLDDHVHYHYYVDLGISVSAPKGLVVPVIRNAEMLQFHELEQQILELAQKARDLTISIDEMKGGTFTITNGGVFGSLMSTPILNPPQSGILGMHNIVQRPVAIDGQVEIRPMMYVALSYDHRIVDGKSSVSFLKNIKELIESPEKMLLNL